MRDIKFRGKRVDNGEWVYGAFVPDALEQTHSDMVSWGFIRRYNGSKSEMIEVDRKTVGEYTGLKDKNGKEIYEGDIVTTDLQRPYNVVVYRDGSFMYNCNDGGDDYYDIMLPILNEPQRQDKYCEVIGNIHDNQELLEGSL